ncbi:MAG: 2-hydroxychromene-2-carboxylate isomerase [Caulobacteraceae bacterium]
MSPSFDLYWSFRSPYSYLLTPRLLALVESGEAACVVKPVLPLAVRTPEFFERQDPLWTSYLLTDMMREAERLSMPLRWPRPDPVARSPSEGYRIHQPHIHRLTALGVAAAERGRGPHFLNEVGHLIWSGEVDDWHEGDHLAHAARRAGLDWDELTASMAGDPARFAAIIEQNQADQRAAGHWGVPLMIFEGEPFFGQDRFDRLLWRMGLTPSGA